MKPNRLLFSAFAIAAALLAAAPAPAQAGHTRDESPEIAAVRAFVAAFNEKDVDKVMTFWVDDDSVYHNMPGPPVKGTEAVRNLINSFVSTADSIDWEILTIAQSGDTVLAERVDRFVFNGKDVVLPCNGAFVFRDGKIAEWRDYFDMATWTKQMSE